jgi:catabolite regulation protein CreA
MDKKMWYLYTMEFYTATKKEILSFATKLLELDNIIVNEVSQAQRPKVTCFLSYVDYRPNTNIAIL